MPYSKTTWKDRAVEHPRTYTMVDNGDGTITLVPAPGTVYEQGTPVNAANLNKIEQGIADATATAEAALPRRIFTSGTYDFNNRGDGSFIEEVKSNASITFQNGPPGVTSGTLLQGEGSHNKWQTQLYMMQGNDRKIFFRTSADVNGTKEWRDWVELITSVGGQTINSSLKISGGLPALKLFDTDSNNSVWLLHDNNAFYLQLRDANDNWIRDIMRLTDDGLTRKLGNDDIWHTGMLRNNNGLLELLHGGAWVPVGGSFIPYSERRGVSGQPAINQANTWTTLVNLNMRGRLEKVTFSAIAPPDDAGYDINYQFRVTVDGKVVWQPSGRVQFGGSDASYTYLGSPDAEDYLYFNSNFKLEALVDVVVPGVGSFVNYELFYRQAI